MKLMEKREDGQQYQFIYEGKSLVDVLIFATQHYNENIVVQLDMGCAAYGVIREYEFHELGVICEF